MQRRTLTLNGGSSTVKFAVFEVGENPVRTLAGEIAGIGTSETALAATHLPDGEEYRTTIRAPDHGQAARRLMSWLGQRSEPEGFEAIGHRVVHGGLTLQEHQEISPDVLEQLRRAQPLDLAHLPREIALIEASAERFPTAVQFACLDTAFHQALPRVAQILPLPRRYFDAGVRRLGFHGLSYSYLTRELSRVASVAANRRVVLAHLGSGASMTALSNGVPVDTTMAFTPSSGLVMATRPGDLDPGLLVHVMRAEGLTPEQADDFLSHQCGLLGVSGLTADVRELIGRRAFDVNANDAIELFCYQAKKWIGAFTAVLGGLDTLVFSGGIGERSAEIRSGICSGLEYLGLRLNPSINARCSSTAGVISTVDSQVVVRVLPTDEELMIARIVCELLERRKQRPQ